MKAIQEKEEEKARKAAGPKMNDKSRKLIE